SASYILHSAGDVPAAANSGPSGHQKRTTGSVQVLGSCGSTDRARNSSSITLTQAWITSGATAPRTARNPLAQKSSINPSILCSTDILPNRREGYEPKSLWRRRHQPYPLG